MNESDKQILRQNAEKYETAYFLEKDPSRFMHLVKGIMNQEAMAFIASSLSRMSLFVTKKKTFCLKNALAQDLQLIG